MDELQFSFQITEEYQDVRIDKALSELSDCFSRSFYQKLIDEKKVFVNGVPVKASYKLDFEDVITYSVPPLSEPLIEAEDIPLDILYEDEDVIVVNKPKGMVVHPAAGHYNGTLVNALLFHCKDSLSGINGVLRPGIVHRIDKDTTGSIIACKNDRAHEKIANQLKEHSIKRVYLAIVCGNVKDDSGVIHAPIGRHPSDRKKMSVVANGKDAITHYEVLERFGNYSFISCILETGRTHQIRVHMASIGHPLLGDEIYGTGKSPFKTYGQCLHAKTLGFIHPVSEKYIETNAPIPEYFDIILKELRKRRDS